MNEIKILIEGYAKEVSDGWFASSTTTLVRSNGKNIIIDPGCNRPLLLEKLKENGLKTGDVDFVYLTHNHSDHILLTGMFEKTKYINDSEIYDNDRTIEHDGNIPGTELQIIPTPGHDPFHSAMVVKTKEGTYVIAGDVFWWGDVESQETDREGLLNHKDEFVKDEAALKQSREKVLVLADFVIPGHGKMFKAKTA